MRNPIKRWKLSPMDLEARKRWFEYSEAQDVMLEYTDRKKAPWFIVDADDKKRARRNSSRTCSRAYRIRTYTRSS